MGGGRPKRPANPGYVSPQRLLGPGLVEVDGRPREALLGAEAMALGRELLLAKVPLPVLGRLADGLEGLEALPLAQALAKHQRLGRAPECLAHPLLGAWWAAARPHLNRAEACRAWALHVRRVAIRAALSAALMAAQLGEQRKRRRAKVPKGTQRGGLRRP